jgi:hypothetical protein
MPVIENIGAVAVGVFVGLLIGFGLNNRSATTQAIISAIGVALAGAPVAFLGATVAKWFYPLGLIAGVLFGRKPERPDASAAGGALVLSAAILAALAVGVTNQHGTTTVSGELRTRHAGTYDVYYEAAFDATPHLVVRCGYCSVTEQRADGFKLTREVAPGNEAIEWIATGVPRKR